VRCSRSTSLVSKLHSSVGLKPVSLLSVNFIDNILPALAHSISICSFVGIRIALDCRL
jgi:hypothetical protein